MDVPIFLYEELSAELRGRSHAMDLATRRLLTAQPPLELGHEFHGRASQSISLHPPGASGTDPPLITPIVPARFRRSIRWMRGDVTVMSFPKSGRTWLRLMIGRALQQHFGTDLDESVIELHRLAEYDSRIPRIYAIHDGIGDESRNPKQFHDRRIILLVRDPRDVIVSYYYELRYRRPTVVGTLDEFVSDPKNVANLLKFYEVWSTRVGCPDATLVLRYEDLHAEPERSLRDVLDFIGVTDISDDVVAEAVEFARFDNMRQYEKDGVFQTAKLRPGLPGEAASFKTRTRRDRRPLCRASRAHRSRT